MGNSMNEKLLEVRAFAQEKIASGAEPPWAWYQYMKLIETVDAILSGSAHVTTESSRQSESRRGEHLQLVDPTCQQESVLLRSVGLPVQMPM
jgi:hypothetical protein